MLVGFMMATVVVFAAGSAKAGFGISNPYLSNDKLLRGTVYEEEVIFSHSEMRGDLKAVIDVSVPGANGWISVDKGKEFALLPNMKTVPIKLRVEVPNNAEFKEYKGKITIKVMPVDVVGGEIALALGGEIAVNLKVIDQKIFDFELRSFKFLDVREGDKATALIRLRNKGNIDGTPSRIILDVYDYKKEKLLLSKENLPIEGTIKAFGEDDIRVDFDTSNLPAGIYWGNAKIYAGDNFIGEFEASLGIMEASKSDLAQMGVMSIFSGKNLLYVIFVLVALLAIMLMWASLRSKKKKGSKRLVK